MEIVYLSLILKGAGKFNSVLYPGDEEQEMFITSAKMATMMVIHAEGILISQDQVKWFFFSVSFLSEAFGFSLN